MLVAKQVADLITWGRIVLAFGLAWLGWAHGADVLPLVVWLMIADWTGDCLDGAIARRSRIHYSTWVGDHDLEADMIVSAGVLAYLIFAGFVDLQLAVIYVLAWAFIFWRWGVPKSLGMLAQTPIYGWFIWVAAHDAPSAGLWIIVWIAVAIALTWPRFPDEIVPSFLDGMRRVWERRRANR